MRHIANVVTSHGVRGFESPPLRHFRRGNPEGHPGGAPIDTPTARDMRAGDQAGPPLPRIACAALLGLLAVSCATRRILQVDTDPPGAVVRLDEEVIGTTPLEHDFTFYGQRRLTLYLPGHRSWSQQIQLKPPWYAYFPIDLFTQVLPPLGIDDREVFHVILVPDTGVRSEPDVEAFVQRAYRRRAEEQARREAEAEEARRRAERAAAEEAGPEEPEEPGETGEGGAGGAAQTEPGQDPQDPDGEGS